MKSVGLLLLTLAVVASVTGRVRANSPDTAPSRGQVFAGVEFGSTDSVRMDAGGDWTFNENWSASLVATRGEYDFEESDLSTSNVTVLVNYDFGHVRVGGGFGRAEIDERSTTQSIFLSSMLELDEWRLRLSASSRDAEFGATEFQENLGGSLGLVSGVSRCEAESLSLQGYAGFQRHAWRAYASARVYDHGDVDCLLTIDTAGNGNGNGNGNGPPLHARGRALGRRLLTDSLESVVDISPALIPREAMLLKSSMALGASRALHSGWELGGEIHRDVEWLENEGFTTVLAFANRDLGRQWNAEFSLGYASSRDEDAVLAGVRVSATLR